MPQSALYMGTVSHTRTLEPSSSLARHSFTYPVWMAYLDLDELDSDAAFPRDSYIVSTSHRALACWRRRDHFGDSARSLNHCAHELLAERFPHLAVSHIRLLTNLSTLGLYNFNPVSIYYCFSAQDALVAVLLEVSNTPWLDKRVYALELGPEHTAKWQKDFHVSPFMDGAHDYEWTVTPPTPSSLSILATSTRRLGCPAFSNPWLTDHTRSSHPVVPAGDSGPVTFVVALELSRVAEPWHAVRSNPIMPLAAVLWIHIHAAAVMRKGVGYVLPPPGARALGLRDLLVHVLVFAVAGMGMSIKAAVEWAVAWVR